MLDNKLEKLLDNIQENGWNCEVNDLENEVCIKNQSPYGRNFEINIDIDEEHPVESFLNDLERNAEEYDVPASNVKDNSSSKFAMKSELEEIGNVLKDGDAIQDMLEDLYADSCEFIDNLEKEDLER